jgi:DNA-binding CsgD family transcriptional regulator
MRQRLRATDRPDEDAAILAEMLAEDLEQWPDGSWLVIDDYQFAMESPASEDFARVLAEFPAVRMLLTTRRRPRWATARRRIYGELEEIDRSMLAMTQDEALSLLQSSDAEAPAFLTSIQGWPALIGLAALSRSRPLAGYSDSSTPDDYFAEELYEAASPELRNRLCDLALAPTDRLARRLFMGPEDGALLAEGIRIGFLVPHAACHELHPALRDFLLQRAAERSDHDDRIEAIGRGLLDESAWDDAFGLVQEHDSNELFLMLVERATDSLLSDGRVSTLEQWLNFAAERRIDSEVVDYAEAEVAFRNALHKKAEVLGAHAAARLGRTHHLTSRAYARAGHSAYLTGNREEASFLLSKALETALTSRDVKDALWGQFLCAVEVERPEGRGLLEQFVQVAGGDSGDIIRIKTGELFLAVRGLGEIKPDLLSGIHLAETANDCLSESSFLNTLMWLAIYLGRYDEALEIGSKQRRLVESFRLDFVLPHLHLREAAAYRGQRKFRESASAIREAEATAGAGDEGLESAITLAIAVSELQQSRAMVALQLLQREPDNRLSPSWRGEYLASRALSFAVAGDEDAALNAAELADALTLAVEARGLSAFARAVVELQKTQGQQKSAIRQAYERAMKDHNVDGMVTAYRAYPPLLKELWSISGGSTVLLSVVEGAHDQALGRAAGLPIQLKRRGIGALSPREQEILALIGQGLTNAEIAQTLFVSVSTVKVHIRHIFEKLGVRTRTEAASLLPE